MSLSLAICAVGLLAAIFYLCFKQQQETILHMADKMGGTKDVPKKKPKKKRAPEPEVDMEYIEKEAQRLEQAEPQQQPQQMAQPQQMMMQQPQQQMMMQQPQQQQMMAPPHQQQQMMMQQQPQMMMHQQHQQQMMGGGGHPGRGGGDSVIDSFLKTRGGNGGMASPSGGASLQPLGATMAGGHNMHRIQS